MMKKRYITVLLVAAFTIVAAGSSFAMMGMMNLISPASSDLYWDDTNKMMAIGTNNPQTTSSLYVDSGATTVPAGVGVMMLSGNSNKERMEIRSAGPVSGSTQAAATVQGKGYGGTISSPTATMQNQWLFAIGGSGHDGTNVVIGNRAMMKFFAEENWTPTAQGAYMTFETTPMGTTSRTEMMRLTGDGNLGIGTQSPTQALEVNGGMRINTTATKPACNATARGTFWYTQGSSKDTVEVCVMNGGYMWIQLF